MPRTARSLVAKGHYHIISRGNNRAAVFHEATDYDQFVDLMAQAQARVSLPILAACVMPNHFHVVVAQEAATDISRWAHWLLTTHTHRYHLKHDTCGRVWQGRFKAFPIEQDGHLLTVMRYVERNALRAGLVARAEGWPWSSLAWRHGGSRTRLPHLVDTALPAHWTEWVNSPQTAEELEAIRACVNHQRPYGGDAWASRQSALSPARSTGRRRGRPPKTRLTAANSTARSSADEPSEENRRMSPISSAGP
jgi:putative transposase